MSDLEQCASEIAEADARLRAGELREYDLWQWLVDNQQERRILLGRDEC